MAYYLLKIIICSGLLLGYYWLLLRNKVFHQYNRFYLLGSMGASFLIPLVKINFWQTVMRQSNPIKLLQIVGHTDQYMDTLFVSSQSHYHTTFPLFSLTYFLISFTLFLLFLHSVYIIYKILKHNPTTKTNNILFVNSNVKNTPFSFFNYIFWNSQIDINSKTGNRIFRHELAHIQQKHSYDKLFMHLVLIAFWCNPFYWLYRKELNMTHEFMADKKAIEDSDTAAFAAMVLQTAYPQQRFQPTNNFFYSPIKRRLIMLTKSNHPKVNYLVRIMVLPLFILIFAAFTIKVKPTNHFYFGKKITVVIDAGHGGMDHGAKSEEGISEKDLSLSFAKKIKALNHNDSIEIILTRETDIFMTPLQKANFAKEKKADIFISVHLDATTQDSFNVKTGMSVWVAKDNFLNAQASKLLASALIGEFSNNYALPVDSLPRQRKIGITVLQENICPSVLIETGFITNKKDMAYLQTDAAKEIFAKNVLTSIEKYADQLSKTNSKSPQNISVQSSTSSSDITFNQVEEEAKFPGGDIAWKNYLIKNINTEIPAKEGFKAGLYTFVLQFIVHTDGSLSDITTKNFLDSKTAMHCIALIKNSPKWIPAMQNGKPVNAYRRQPISFWVQ